MSRATALTFDIHCIIFKVMTKVHVVYQIVCFLCVEYVRDVCCLQVVLYNGAFNSPAARVRVSFWRLPPRPLSQSISSSNLTVNFTLEPSTHSDIASVAVQVCALIVCGCAVCVGVGVCCVRKQLVVDRNVYACCVRNNIASHVQRCL